LFGLAVKVAGTFSQTGDETVKLALIRTDTYIVAEVTQPADVVTVSVMAYVPEADRIRVGLGAVLFGRKVPVAGLTVQK
jgi:hypothetical protein